MSKNNPDIQKILDEISADISEFDNDPRIISFQDFWAEKYSANDTDFRIASFLSDVSMLQAHNQVSYYKELSSYRKGISSIVLLVKRVIRKLVAFLFLPVIAEQNEINLSVVRIAMHLRRYINSQSCPGENEQSLRNEIQQQREQIDSLNRQIELLSKKIDAMEKEVR